MRNKIPCSICIIVATLLQFTIGEDPVVVTDCGKVSGKSFDVNTDAGDTRTVHEFLNIPYAVPPTGELRWRAPVKLKDGKKCWKGTLEYNDHIVQCTQLKIPSSDVIGDEDCLVLNVRAPISTNQAPLPVIVWIHGGGMFAGHSRMKGLSPDNEFAASMNVVSVSINYRLNYFGFLSLEELWENKYSGGFGNYGIMDQIQALKWIRNNIRNFGGDPNKVTVLGDGAGGTATYGLLTASAGLAKGLFQKVIAMSGNPNYRTTHIKANGIFRPFINITNCQRHSKSDVAKCLRNLDQHAVASVMKTMPMTAGYAADFPENKPYPNYVPVEILDPLVVKYTMKDFVSYLQSSALDLKLDILLGNMAQESSIGWYVPPLPRWNSWTVLRKALEPKVDAFKKGFFHKLLNTYIRTSWVITPFVMYSTMLSDIRVSCTVARKAELLTSYKPFRVSAYVVSQPIKFPGLHEQAAHGFDALALFDYKWEKFHKKPSETDKTLQKNIRGIFKSFFHSDPKFQPLYRDKTIEFWENMIMTWTSPYHEKDCKLLKDIGLLKHSWGNLGIYDD